MRQNCIRWAPPPRNRREVLNGTRCSRRVPFRLSDQVLTGRDADPSNGRHTVSDH